MIIFFLLLFGFARPVIPLDVILSMIIGFSILYWLPDDWLVVRHVEHNSRASSILTTLDDKVAAQAALARSSGDQLDFVSIPS